jgi:hypothetical protein
MHNIESSSRNLTNNVMFRCAAKRYLAKCTSPSSFTNVQQSRNYPKHEYLHIRGTHGSTVPTKFGMTEEKKTKYNDEGGEIRMLRNKMSLNSPQFWSRLI